jgi:hypothetical protein
MTTRNYIVLTDSAGFERRFRVPQGTLTRKVTKMQTRDRTLTGRADTQEGPHIALHSLQVRVRNLASGADPEDLVGYPDWGVLADVRHFFSLRNPQGTPSNRLTYTDHLAADHTVELLGEMEELNVTPYLDGDESWFYVTLMLEEVS